MTAYVMLGTHVWDMWITPHALVGQSFDPRYRNVVDTESEE